MGLLDSLFSGNGYGGQGGGLLDLIRQSQMQNDQYQPSAGFQDQAQPMVIGNYQMPRMGAAPLFAPQQDQAAIPPNAQPTQGQIPPQQMAPPQMQPQQELPPALGGGASMLGRIGSPDGLIARLTGNDTRSQTQQNAAAQYKALQQALINNGDTPQAAASKAMLAVMNPEAAKTVIPELFTTKEKYQVVSDDPLAGKKYGFVNERDQTVNGKPISAQPSENGGLAGLQAAQNAGVTGPALYENIPAAMRNTVKAMIEGRQPLPSTTAMRSPATLALIDAAHAVDPTFDATSWATRVKGQADFYGGGKSSEIMRKANQSALHFGELVSDKMSELPGHTMPAFNAVANFVNTNLLGKGAQGNFMVNAHALADELAGLFKGANLSDTEIRAWESRLTPDMSEEQQRGMAKTLLGLYRDSVSALEKKRVESIGSAASEKKGAILGPEAEAALSGVEKFANGGARAAPGGVDRSAIEAEMKKRGLLK